MIRISLQYTLLMVLLIAGCQSAPNLYIASVLTDVNESNLYKHVDNLTAIGSRFSCFENSDSIYVTNASAQLKKLAYLSQCLEEYGYNVQRSSYPVAKFLGGKAVNLIALKEGIIEPNRVIELGAHYDTRANPGADDNCSGVAGVLEVARIIATVPTERSIRFCLYDLEEVDEAPGSKGHAQLVKNKAFSSKEEHFDGAIVFEMIGYAVNEKNTQETPIRIPLFLDPPRTGNFILVVGNIKSSYLGQDFEQAIENYVDDLNYYSAKRIGSWFQRANRSDHSSYWREGLPAIMITDTGEFRNPHYHQMSDTIETLNFKFLSQVVQATVGMLLDYAQPVLENQKTEQTDASARLRRP
jgi:hypothetical protein